MNGIAIFRATLLTLPTAFGASGIFFLYYSCMSAPVGDYALVFWAWPRQSRGTLRNRPSTPKPALV